MRLAGYRTSGRATATTIAAFAALAAIGCGPEELGKYQVSPDDPALSVSREELAKVNEVIDARAKEDRAAGITIPAGKTRLDLVTIFDEAKKNDERAETEVASSGSAPAASGSAGAGDLPAGVVKIRSIYGKLPAGWREVPPASSMRLADYAVGASAGDPEDGIVSVFYFGPSAGGSQANIDRWIGQFSQPDGSPTRDRAETTELVADGMKVTLLEVSGTMAASSMPGAPETPERPNWRLLASIVETDEGPIFFKGTGPDKTMRDNHGAMLEFLNSLSRGVPKGDSPRTLASADAPKQGYGDKPAEPVSALDHGPDLSKPPVPDAPAAAPAPQPAPAAPAATAAGERRVKFGPIHAELPPTWRSVPPASSMRLAELEIPAEAGDPEPGIMSVFHFGPDAGGIEANIARWENQMIQPDGRPSSQASKRVEMKVGGMDVLLVQVKGTMAASNMPGAPASPERPGWQLLGVIATAPDGPYFFKATGPEKTIDANYAATIQFLTSFSLTPPASAPVEVAAAAEPAAEAPPSSAPATAEAASPAPAQPATAAPAPAPRKAIQAGAIHALLPEGWESVPPASSMRLAELRIPPVEGDPEAGVMTVFYFGPDAGGIDANIQRWIGQFAQPDGRASSALAKTDRFQAGGMEVMLLDLTGTMAASNMPGAPPSPERPGWQLLGAIATAPNGPHFFKATGPEKTMTANREKMVEFVKSFSTQPIAGADPAKAEPASPAPPASAPAAMKEPAPPPPAAAAPASAPPANASANAGPGREERFLNLVGALPGDWRTRKPETNIRLAEIVLPPSQGDPAEGGLITVFYFGPQGGTVEENLDRWYDQFTQPDGSRSKDHVLRESLSAGGMNVHFVDLKGTMQAQRMIGAPGAPEREGWRLLGGIVQTPEGDYYFKGTGPEKTMGDHREKMVKFLTGLRWEKR